MRDRRLGPFNDNNRRQCFNVTIRDDTQRESTEYFDVTVHTCPGPTPDGPGRIIFNPRSGRTTIIDGELQCSDTFFFCVYNLVD